MDWISVEDRLPEKSGYQQCWSFKSVEGVGDHHKHWFCRNKGWFETRRTVTHWMPLPPPPKEMT